MFAHNVFILCILHSRVFSLTAKFDDAKSNPAVTKAERAKVAMVLQLSLCFVAMVFSG
jgi:hypothetical protein